MARERWFYLEGGRRKGPLSLQRLVESLLTLHDPRGCLVWHRGLPAWTKAKDVQQVAEQLAPFVAERPATPIATPALTEREADRDAILARPSAKVPAPLAKVETLLRQPGWLLAAAAVGVLAAIAVWGLWFRGTDAGPGAQPGTDPQTGAATAPAARGPGPVPVPSAAGPPQAGRPGQPDVAAGFAGWEVQESLLPPAELPKLRGVAGWSGNKLTVTLYNGSTWRITELLVRVSRLEGDEFVDSPTPESLLPLPDEIDADVAQLLDKVAPDRRKPGVNPLDTGPFEGDIGPRPEAYRWSIEGARGYPPRAGR